MGVFETEQEIDVGQRHLSNLSRTVERKVDAARSGDLHSFRESGGASDLERPEGLRRHGKAES